MIVNEVKILALMAAFGGLAVALSLIYFSVPPWGDVTPASTPISVVATIAPWPVGMGASLIKGLGVSLWTGEWFMEIPVGVGDSLMAGFTYYLVKKKVKPTRAVVLGQLSRYLFTSGMVALYISTVVSLGIPSPLGGDIVGKFNSYAGRIGLGSNGHPFLLCMMIVWVARLPSTTLSILLNSLLAFIVIASGEKQLRAVAQYFAIDARKKTEKASTESIFTDSSPAKHP